MKGKLLSKTKLYLKRSSPMILTVAAAAGVVGTSIMSVKATLKAVSILDKVKEDSDDELTRTEIVRVVGPSYIPAAMLGVSTIICIFGVNALNRKQQAALTSAYALLDNTYKEYKKKVRELYGDDADIKIRESLCKEKYEKTDINVDAEKQLFYDEFSGRYFESTLIDVKDAEYHFNRNFVLRGYATLNEFYDFLAIPKMKNGEALGWSFGAGGAFYGYEWIDFEHTKTEMPDGLECWIISMPFPPTVDYMDY